MVRNVLTAVIDYGLIKKDCDYVVIEEGYDWYLIRSSGKSQYVFKWVLE
jgi:hypothetical protein